MIEATSLSAKNEIVRRLNRLGILHDAQWAWIETDLRDLDFTSANLQRTDLGGNDLQGTNFWGANLTDAKLGSTNLRRADFSKAILSGASFQGAILDATTTLPKLNKYDPELGLEQLKEFGAVINN